jgi:hypothetical protein
MGKLRPREWGGLGSTKWQAILHLLSVITSSLHTPWPAGLSYIELRPSQAAHSIAGIIEMFFLILG